MSQFERVCPKCGTSNAYERSRCSKCGTNLTPLLAPPDQQAISPLTDMSARGLAFAATMFIARVGFRLLWRGVKFGAAQAMTRANNTAVEKDGPVTKATRAGDNNTPDFVIRGWRSWSVRDGEKKSSGSEKFEWQIHRKK
jgi:hypothetical protein